MAERLTKKIVKTIQDKYSLGSYLYYGFAKIDDTNKLLNKLGKLEDILEKYGIESVEELARKLKDIKNDKSVIRGLQKAIQKRDIKLSNETKHSSKLQSKNAKSREKINSIEEQNTFDKLKLIQDRDTWKRACELACENMKLPVDILIGNKEFNECHSIVEYFYQQAKKESENK